MASFDEYSHPEFLGLELRAKGGRKGEELVGSDGFDGVHSGGGPCGNEAGDDADNAGDEEAEEDVSLGELEGEIEHAAGDECACINDDKADDSAQ